MPERVKWIRVLLAELQRINSHLVWLGTHAMDVGAVSVMLYCFRERELLLNINELIAGFRMFPSYIRVGGLREDLPRGFHEAVQCVPRAAARRSSTSTKTCSPRTTIFLKRTQGVGTFNLEQCYQYGLVGPIARAAGVDLRRAQGVPVLRLRDLRLRRADAAPTATSTTAICVRVARDARERQDLPAGARAHHADRRVRRSTTRASCRRRRTRSTPRWKR